MASISRSHASSKIPVIMTVDAVRVAEELWGQKAKVGAADSI